MTHMKATPRQAGRWWVAACAVVIILIVPAISAAQDVPDYEDYEDTDPAALSDFRQPLEPYGTWVEDPKYGIVWVPSVVVVGKDFAPYRTAGHWAVTEEGD
jgi:hypothetical protein